MKIDLTCPIEITRTEVLSDDRGRCRGYVDVINVCDHPIRRVEGRAVWLAQPQVSTVRNQRYFTAVITLATPSVFCVIIRDVAKLWSSWYVRVPIAPGMSVKVARASLMASGSMELAASQAALIR